MHDSRSAGLEQRSHPDAPTLTGKRILVVEDDFLLASELSLALGEAGAEVIGPAGTVETALDLLARDCGIDGAILDINLRGRMSFDVADLLAVDGVPFLFVTGYDDTVLPQRFAGAPRLEKPINPASAAYGVAELFSAR